MMQMPADAAPTRPNPGSTIREPGRMNCELTANGIVCGRYLLFSAFRILPSQDSSLEPFAPQKAECM